MFQEFWDKLKNILDENNYTIEFALLNNDEGDTIPYMFDLVDDNSIDQYSIDELNSGILSRGKITGKILNLPLESDLINIIEFHFHDSTDNINRSHEPIIFLCELPNIKLLKILSNYDNKNIGFIFKQGSILSHFSILLREKNIPAIICENQLNIKNETIVTIDALSNNTKQEDRIKYENLSIN